MKAYFASVNAKGGVYGRKLVLDSKRDDGLANNRGEVQGLLTKDDVFAVLPVAVQLFTGSKLLADEKVPTYGWDINEEWGSENSSTRSVRTSSRTSVTTSASRARPPARSRGCRRS